jgi:hypothetical protein
LPEEAKAIKRLQENILVTADPVITEEAEEATLLTEDEDPGPEKAEEIQEKEPIDREDLDLDLAVVIPEETTEKDIVPDPGKDITDQDLGLPEEDKISFINNICMHH